MATDFYKRKYGKKKSGWGLFAGVGALIAFFLFGKKK